MNEENMNRLLTIKEVAEILKMSPYIVREYARDGLIKSYRMGKGKGKGSRIRIYEDDVRQFIESGNKVG